MWVPINTLPLENSLVLKALKRKQGGSFAFMARNNSIFTSEAQKPSLVHCLVVVNYGREAVTFELIPVTVISNCS